MSEKGKCMPVPTHVVNVVSLVLCLSMLTLQNGCSNSGSGDAQAPATNPAATLRLALTTTNGVTVLVADGQSTVPIRMTVANGVGTPMSGAAVTFATTDGTLSASPVVRVAQGLRSIDADVASRATGNSLTVSTDTNGIAQVLLTASTTTGLATVTADVQGFRTHVDIFFTAGPAARVQLDVSNNAVSAGGTATLTATVADANGNRVPGETVMFAFSTNTSGASLSAPSGVTNSNGQTTVTYTAGSTGGADTVRAATTSTSVAESISITVTAASTGGTTSPVVNRIDLLVSSPQLASDASGSVTLTALVRNTSNNVVSGVPVLFAADSGSIQVVNGTTGLNGTATALLTTLGDSTNRLITGTATAGGLSNTNTVQVEGTTLSVSGTTALVQNASTRLTISLRDSAGAGIQNRAIRVSSAAGNSLSAPTVTTDANGQATVDVTGTVTGADTITVDALGALATIVLSVSGDTFVFIEPTPALEVPLNIPQSITIHWDQAGVPQVGRTITFFATRGDFIATASCPVIPHICTIGPDGNASASISSNNAGPVVINANTGPSGPANQISVEFVATLPTSLILQATLTSLAVHQQSVITAVLRDAQNNLVKNQTVSFSLTDVSGGQISPASAITDSLGRASTVYTAGAVPSAHDGVRLHAAAAGTQGDTLFLTVAQQALFVTLGTANQVQELSTTQYALPYSVLVTDANGNPLASTGVTLSILPTQYRKGPCGNPNPPTCPSEDSNRNGILDPGEDTNNHGNNNGILDPGNVATIPMTVTTDTTGFAFFDVVYAQGFAELVEVELNARAVVVGSEGASQVKFFLPGGCISSPSPPFGSGLNCTDNDFP